MICQQCRGEFTYAQKPGTVAKRFCPACAKERIRARKKAALVKVRLGTEETPRLPGVMTRVEAAEKLALWEAMEYAKSHNGYMMATKLSRHRIHQIERTALLKIRRALQPDWDALKKDL